MSAMGRVVEQALIFVPTIEAFVDGSCTADDFEEAYSRLVKRTPGILEREVSEIVNGLFGDVDAYVAEDRLRGNDDLDAGQLLTCATGALEQLRQLSRDG
ncbi:colicin immunity domain-containing protein [Rhodococcus sp. IEGM 1354]|uniref:colicin immunity domain-containing protein n=1 Tax=Rhodococcus sp. IEGM 1354 TaxID=3047088 RepID=UPI0024B83B3E|nr:colicin immunity domain-containing protein [Rhodococcus sp. IEGM 1354]MDI9932335.1 colicin immunity domain-containing protein [Rhodococcus sp. IEGM 1354]